MAKLSMEEKYKKNFFKSGEMEALYQFKADPWRLRVDGHDRYLKVLTTIDGLFRSGNPHGILEIGCGEGVLTEMLARRYCNSQIWALDISKTAVIRAADYMSDLQMRQGNIHLMAMDIGVEELPERVNQIECIVLGDILYYLNSKEEVDHAIQQFVDVLMPSGFIVMTEFPKTKKYVKLLGEKFQLQHESREVVRYQKTPIDLVENGTLTYRLTVFGQKEKAQ